MNEEYQRKLEAEIDHALSGLRDLPAPRRLIANVLADIERRAHLPWYRRSWTMWPKPVRALSFGFLLAMFGGICFASWQLWHHANFAAVGNVAGTWFTPFVAVWSLLSALLGALASVIKNLGTGFTIGCIAAIGLGYAMCVGLGTVYVRLGMVRRRS